MTDARSQPGSREAVAKIIYDAFPFEPRHGMANKPEWIPGGNSWRQDDARRAADAILSLTPLQQGDDKPKHCPTCGSSDPASRSMRIGDEDRFCQDPWHPVDLCQACGAPAGSGVQTADADQIALDLIEKFEAIPFDWSTVRAKALMQVLIVDALQRAAITRPGKPVAWRWQWRDSDHKEWNYSNEDPRDDERTVQPLYLAALSLPDTARGREARKPIRYTAELFLNGKYTWCIIDVLPRVETVIEEFGFGPDAYKAAEEKLASSLPSAHSPSEAGK